MQVVVGLRTRLRCPTPRHVEPDGKSQQVPIHHRYLLAVDMRSKVVQDRLPAHLLHLDGVLGFRVK